MTETSKKKNKQTPSNTTDPWFLKGIEEFERGTDYETVLMWTSELQKATLRLEAISYHEGYIKRKYGIVDETGEEVFS